DPIITLKVKNTAGGTDNIHVHQSVLCQSSSFFQNAMKKEWAGSKDKPHVINLPEDCTETVKIYIEWLYSNEIPAKLYMTHKANKSNGEQEAREAEKNFIVLAKAYIFGEKIIDSVFTEEVSEKMQEILATSMGWPTAECVKMIYEWTPSNSPLRRLITSNLEDTLWEDELNSGILDFLDTYPQQALVDALKAIVGTRPPP
ncbi:hypothetical protein COCCADRAFT_91597, partial [Bipolaris zeicola 26-R-13]